jgi:hypothetical protein
MPRQNANPVVSDIPAIGLDDYLNQQERNHAPIESLSAFGQYAYQRGMWRMTSEAWAQAFENFLNSVPE